MAPAEGAPPSPPRAKAAHTPTSPTSDAPDACASQTPPAPADMPRADVPPAGSPAESVDSAVGDVVSAVVSCAADRADGVREEVAAAVDAMLDDAAAGDVHDVVHAVVRDVVDTAAGKAEASAALDAERAKVQGLISGFVGRAYGDAARAPASAPPPPPPAGVPRGDARAWAAPARPPVEALSWTQSPESVTVTSVLRASGARASDVRVVFGASMVSVVVRGEVALREELPAPLDADSCLWSIDRSEPELPCVTLELEKARAAWWPVLFLSHDPAEYVVHQGGKRGTGAAAAAAPPPPPPPPPPQAERAATAEEPPPDAPLPEEGAAVGGEGEGEAAEDGEEESGDEESQEKAVAAMKKLAENSRRGQPTNREDVKVIIQQYQASFDAGGARAPEAALQLATFYHHGIGVERSDLEAVRLYKYAMERGVVDNLAAFQLGLICNQGCEGMEPDAKEAVRWWLVSARLGNAVAMFNLGVMFMNGNGCTMDPHVALKFFQQAKAINPKLRTPDISQAQLAERVARAQRLKKQKQKADLTDEQRLRRHDQTMETLRYTAYATGAVVAASVGAVLVRNWWRNRL